jgi:hypothetical protein
VRNYRPVASPGKFRLRFEGPDRAWRPARMRKKMV